MVRKEKNIWKMKKKVAIVFGILFLLAFPFVSAKDLIITNNSQNIFIVNGTSGEIILTPSFGKIGIGVTSPSASFHVNGTARIGESASGYWEVNATSGDIKYIRSSVVETQISSSGGNSWFGATSGTSGSGAKLFLNGTSGNLGIGDSTPTEGVLTVTGPVYFTDTITAPSFSGTLSGSATTVNSTSNANACNNDSTCDITNIQMSGAIKSSASAKSYGAIDIWGKKGGSYSGINFFDGSGVYESSFLVDADGATGMVIQSVAWQWYFNQNGVLTVGTIPYTSVTNLASASVNYATSAGSASSVTSATSAGNADTLDGYHFPTTGHCSSSGQCNSGNWAGQSMVCYYPSYACYAGHCFQCMA